VTGLSIPSTLTGQLYALAAYEPELLHVGGYSLQSVHHLNGIWAWPESDKLQAVQEAQGALLLDLLERARQGYGWALSMYASPEWTVQVFCGKFAPVEGHETDARAPLLSAVVSGLLQAHLKVAAAERVRS